MKILPSPVCIHLPEICAKKMIQQSTFPCINNNKRTTNKLKKNSNCLISRNFEVLATSNTQAIFNLSITPHTNELVLTDFAKDCQTKQLDSERKAGKRFQLISITAALRTHNGDDGIGESAVGQLDFVHERLKPITFEFTVAVDELRSAAIFLHDRHPKSSNYS